MRHTADTMPVTLWPAGIELRPVVEQLAQFYRHDMSEFLGHLPAEDGRFGFRSLPLFFEEPGREALLIRYGEAPGGFVLTWRMPEGATSISAFFVVRALRRRGVGRRAALQVLRSRPGPWAIAFQQANEGAARFWRGIATAAVGSDWHEETRPVPPPAPASLPDDHWLFLNTATTVQPSRDPSVDS
ncbi:GNAT family N-acetyltransferase [Streptomyces sp. NBC_00490]|uniref:GNAT family N-acetyltransferase n=1 Tax=Streptomyces sp. NBC_00490 TaxID=2903657 RepID=UPI002E193D77